MREVYMMVTRDSLELPLAVANTINELAFITGKDEGVIRSAISRVETGHSKKSIYVRVLIDESKD